MQQVQQTGICADEMQHERDAGRRSALDRGAVQWVENADDGVGGHERGGEPTLCAAQCRRLTGWAEPPPPSRPSIRGAGPTYRIMTSSLGVAALI